MHHFKSWSYLNKQLSDRLCNPLKDRISYFMTRYSDVHNSYGRASIRLDKKELVVFSWIEMYRQESDIHAHWRETGIWDDDDPGIKSKWENNCTLSDWDFLQAATDFLQMSISDALDSDNCLIRILAIMDKRVGKRTIQQIQANASYKAYPQWVQQFYTLRLSIEIPACRSDGSDK